MIKGLFSILFGTFIVTCIIVGIIYLFFSGILLSVLGFIVGGVIAATIILFIIIFFFALILIFALFYYISEKKTEIKPGEYKIEQEKGKTE